MHMRSLVGILAVTSSIVSLGACRGCDDLGAVKAVGAFDPPILELGPITIGSECPATMNVTNTGQEDLTVDEKVLENTEGDFKLRIGPSLVKRGGSEPLIVDYKAAGTIGEVQSTGVSIQTNDPDNEGIIKGTITAIVTDAPAPAQKTSCDTADEAQSPCTNLDFGATQVRGAGVERAVTLINDGNADLHLTGIVFNGGNPDFTLVDVRRGTALLPFDESTPVTVFPGRTAECGAPSGNDNTVTINVHYTPQEIESDTATLILFTDAVNGAEIDVELAGFGSDIGVSMTPDIVNFGDLGEGNTDTIDVLVKNIGTSNVSVNEACVDIDDDRTCDARCTGQAGDTALSGTISCRVTDSDGALSSVGFVLEPTDAVAGGDDEHTVSVTWAPQAGAADMPSTAVLLLRTGLLGGCDATHDGGCFTAPIVGGSIGALQPSVGGVPVDFNGVFIEAGGDPADFTTWAGEVTIRLTNVGNATVNISDVAFDDEVSSTINDDYTLGALSSTAIAPGDHADFTVSYDEVAPGNDAAASAETTNILVTHDGAGGGTLIKLDVVPPR